MFISFALMLLDFFCVDKPQSTWLMGSVLAGAKMLSMGQKLHAVRRGVLPRIDYSFWRMSPRTVCSNNGARTCGQGS